MNIQPLSKYFPKDSLLSTLPDDMFGEYCKYIQWETLVVCYRASKGFKLFIEEKKLFEYHLSQDGLYLNQKKELLYRFYEKESPSIWSLLKNGVPFPHLRKFITEDLVVKEQKAFFQCLFDEFKHSPNSNWLWETNSPLKQDALIKICFFAQHSDEELRIEARKYLKLLKNDSRLHPDLRHFIETACLKFDIPISVFLSFLYFVGFAVLSLTTPLMSIPLMCGAAIIVNIVPIFELIKKLRIYIQYGHWPVYNDLALLLPLIGVLLGVIFGKLIY